MEREFKEGMKEVTLIQNSSGIYIEGTLHNCPFEGDLSTGCDTCAYGGDFIYSVLEEECVTR